MHNSKPMSTPMSNSIKLTAIDEPFFEDPQLYPNIVGSLQYLAFTHQDISFAVKKVCQYMYCPRISHWQTVKRILRYLHLTNNFGLKFSTTSSVSLSAYSNADWADCPDNYKSTGGFCVNFGSHLISWSLKKQPPLPDHPHKPNIRLLQIPHVNLFGCNHCLVKLVFFSLNHPLFGVITLVPPISPLILFYILALSMLNLTTILFMTMWLPKHSRLPLSLAKTSLQIFLLSLYLLHALIFCDPISRLHWCLLDRGGLLRQI